MQAAGGEKKSRLECPQPDFPPHSPLRVRKLDFFKMQKYFQLRLNFMEIKLFCIVSE